MGLTHLTVSLKPLAGAGAYESLFLLDTGATDSLAPGNQLRLIGVREEGHSVYELADGGLRSMRSA